MALLGQPPADRIDCIDESHSILSVSTAVNCHDSLRLLWRFFLACSDCIFPVNALHLLRAVGFEVGSMNSENIAIVFDDKER